MVELSLSLSLSLPVLDHAGHVLLGLTLELLHDLGKLLWVLLDLITETLELLVPCLRKWETLLVHKWMPLCLSPIPLQEPGSLALTVVIVLE